MRARDRRRDEYGDRKVKRERSPSPESYRSSRSGGSGFEEKPDIKADIKPPLATHNDPDDLRIYVQNSERHVVGLEYVTEIKRYERNERRPRYRCEICNVREQKSLSGWRLIMFRDFTYRPRLASTQTRA